MEFGGVAGRLKEIVASGQETKYTLPMVFSAYSYWFRFWVPPN
jgi:hypothetical protein